MADGLTQEQLDQLQALLEGRSAQGFVPWWREHSAALKKQMSKTDFQRFKFKRVEEAHELLRRAGRDVTWGPAADRAAAAAVMPETQLDEDGWPLHDVRRALYGGAGGLLQDGQTHAASAILSEHLTQALADPAWEKRHGAVAGMVFDAHLAEALGESDVALGLRRAVAALEVDDDVLVGLVAEARRLLS